jgi:hypothetical protein
MDMVEFPNWEVNRYYGLKKKQFNHVLNMYVGDSDYVSNRCAFSDGTVLNLVVVLKLILNKWKRCKVFSI